MRANRLIFVSAAALIGLSGVPSLAWAQGNASPPGRIDTGDSDKQLPKAIDKGLSGSSSEPLSDRLDRSDEVIRPPVHMDPGMTQSPPAVGPKSTPVIPPPGTGGNTPQLDPK